MVLYVHRNHNDGDMFLTPDHFFIPCVPLSPHTKGQMQGNIIWFFVRFVVLCRFCCYCPFLKNSIYTHCSRVVSRCMGSVVFGLGWWVSRCCTEAELLREISLDYFCQSCISLSWYNSLLLLLLLDQFQMVATRLKKPIFDPLRPRNVPKVAFETVSVFVRLTMTLSCSFKKNRLERGERLGKRKPLSTPLSSRRSMVWCPWLCARK